MNRSAISVVMLVCSICLLSGCRAFNSSYDSKEADLASKPRPAPSTSSNTKPPAGGAESAPVDYSKDATVCKTPDGVKVDKNPNALMSNSGWANPVDGEEVIVTATKKGQFSATISIQKVGADKSSFSLTFTVKQTAADKFSACDFSYSEGKDRSYPGVTGTVMVDRINAVDGNNLINSGSFELTFSRSASATATKVQSVYLGATSPTAINTAGPFLDGAYFVDTNTETPAK